MAECCTLLQLASICKQEAQSYCDVFHQRGAKVINGKKHDYHKDTHFRQKREVVETLKERFKPVDLEIYAFEERQNKYTVSIFPDFRIPI